jgi:uncharacterized protein YndB with AHSA1/START domain
VSRRHTGRLINCRKFKKLREFCAAGESLMTTITPDQDAIISEIDIAAPPERVFKAISDAAEIRRRSPELSVYEMDPRVGGKWRLEMRPPQPYHGFSVIHHGGEILEFDPPRLLIYTWTANFHTDPEKRSTVRGS